MATATPLHDDAYYAALEERLGPGEPMEGAYAGLALAVLQQAVELARGDPGIERLMGPSRRRVVVGWRRRARRFLGSSGGLAGFWAQVAGIRSEAFYWSARRMAS